MSGMRARSIRGPAPVTGLLITALVSAGLISGCSTNNRSSCGSSDAFSARINNARHPVQLLSCSGTIETPPPSATVHVGDTITIRWPVPPSVRSDGTALSV